MTSAPSRCSSRTLRRSRRRRRRSPTAGPGAAPMNGTSAPDGYQSSPWPPVWLSMMIEICIRGPAISPSATRLLDPEVGAAGVADRRDPDRERLLEVLAPPRRTGSENGCWTAPHRSTFEIADVGVAVEQARAGSSGRERRSPSSPSSPSRRPTIRPSSIATSAARRVAPVPSNTRPPLNTVRVMRSSSSTVHSPAPAGRARHEVGPRRPSAPASR